MRSLPLWLPVLALCFSTVLFAADAVPAVSPKPAHAPAVALDPHVQSIITSAAQYYAGMKSFETDISSTTHVETPVMKNDMISAFHVALQQPASFSLVMTTGMLGGSVISDGKTWITYEPMLGKYTSNDAPATMEDLLQPQNLVLVEGGTPLGIEALLSKDPVKGLSAALKSSEYVGLEKIGDQSAHHLRIVSSVYVQDFWIADGPKPLLLQSEVTPDMSAALKGLSAEQKKKMPPGMDQMKMVRTTVYTHWQIDQPVAAATFQFQPPPGAQLVDEFFTPPPHPLVGKMAPDFQLNDLDGHPVSLASLRGKIVVLDFWATWCGPCVASLPLVSSVAESLKDKGVVFYAANLKETADKVRQFQTEKTLVFPVLLDADGKVSDLYQAKAIPETVLIDKTGKIQAVHVGYDAGIRKKLTAQLNDMLAGKDLAASAPAPAVAPPAPAGQ
jgi:thiol-disulfide isomerase/thioredoxin